MMERIPDNVIIESYSRTHSCKKTGIEVGLNHSSVHERLVRLGMNNKQNVFTKEHDALLMREYLIYRDAGQLDKLATVMGRTKQFICRQAKRLGLTDGKHPKKYFGKWKYMPEQTARVLFEQFKSSSYTMGQFCNKFGHDELGFSKTMQKFFPDEWDLAIESKIPSQTMYRYGRAFEYRVRDRLRKQGYFVLRSPRSGSPVDLVAIKRGIILFVQCKRSGVLPPKEWNELFDLCESVGAIPILSACPTGKDMSHWRILKRKDGLRGKQPMIPVQLEWES